MNLSCFMLLLSVPRSFFTCSCLLLLCLSFVPSLCSFFLSFFLYFFCLICLGKYISGWDLFVKSPTIFGTSGYVLASSIEGLSLSLIVEQDACNLNVGKFSDEYTSANIEVEIRATDQNGNGLTSAISVFDLRLKET